MSEQEQWYTNKELFEQINVMRGEFKDLSNEMRETRNMIKEYNGLRDEVGKYRKEVEELKEALDVLQAKAEGRSSVLEGIKSWGGWIIALLSFVITLWRLNN
ncbi:hypothetical protein PU629_07335 [Pullulanibacillus sp. KACC 23026]|uniref:hypothetical protein n=1 Tax=Pullulanibacillus sp. KACC 23026 TaxID=3028315 RepID=UPI0023B1C8C8|nr:hypothetical protein [Pullulanibacillus sp. KACC 23026]WEG14170.1 hypothetical protein PU629_07335 [Pullulanibacillus sp. KACC 23026]